MAPLNIFRSQGVSDVAKIFLGGPQIVADQEIAEGPTVGRGSVGNGISQQGLIYCHPFSLVLHCKISGPSKNITNNFKLNIPKQNTESYSYSSTDFANTYKFVKLCITWSNSAQTSIYRKH